MHTIFTSFARDAAMSAAALIASPLAVADTIPGEGLYAVGVDIAPGAYKTRVS